MKKYDNIFKAVYIIGTIAFVCIQILSGILLYRHLNTDKNVMIIFSISVNLIWGIAVILLLRKNIKRIFYESKTIFWIWR